MMTNQGGKLRSTLLLFALIRAGCKEERDNRVGQYPKPTGTNPRFLPQKADSVTNHSPAELSGQDRLMLTCSGSSLTHSANAGSSVFGGVSSARDEAGVSIVAGCVLRTKAKPGRKVWSLQTHSTSAYRIVPYGVLRTAYTAPWEP